MTEKERGARRLAQRKYYHSGKGKEANTRWRKANQKRINTIHAAYMRTENGRRLIRRRAKKSQQIIYMRNFRLKLYGLTIEAYEDMLKAQYYKCAICSKPHEEDGRKRKRLVVDHDHKTGKIRGLLCNGCNIALWQLGDDIESVKNVLSYLERAKS